MVIYVYVLIVIVWNTINYVIELDSCYYHIIHIHMVVLVFEYKNLDCEKSYSVNELGWSSWLVSEIWKMNWIYMNIAWCGDVDKMVIIDNNTILCCDHP